jgi:hypothetical protein
MFPAPDDETLVEQLQEQYGESSGLVAASRAESHPFIRGIFMLQLALGLYGAMVAIQPFFIYMSTDGVSMQIAMFVIALLLAAVVLAQAHDARMEEMLFLMRCRGYGQATRLGANIPVAVLLFATCVLSQLVANMFAARTGDLGTGTHVFLSVSCVVEIGGAIVLVQRQRNHYIINDL